MSLVSFVTRGDALRACPWLLYIAPLALFIVGQSPVSLFRSLGRWGDGDEVFGEAPAVGVEEFVDAIEMWGADD